MDTKPFVEIGYHPMNSTRLRLPLGHALSFLDQKLELTPSATPGSPRRTAAQAPASQPACSRAGSDRPLPWPAALLRRPFFAAPLRCPFFAAPLRCSGWPASWRTSGFPALAPTRLAMWRGEPQDERSHAEQGVCGGGAKRERGGRAERREGCGEAGRAGSGALRRRGSWATATVREPEG